MTRLTVAGRVDAADIRIFREAVGHDRPRPSRQQIAHARIVRARDDRAVERHAIAEFGERLEDRRERSVSVHVFAVHIGDDSHRRRQLEKRPVAFVGLGDHVAAAAEPRVAAKGAEPAANHRRRIETRLFEHQRDHRRRRGLPVRAGDGDADAEAHHFRQHFRAGDDRNATGAGGDDLRVVGSDRRRDDHDVRVADMAGGVAVKHGDAGGGQPVGHVRPPGVRPAHLVTEVRQEFRDSAHPTSTHADKMHAPRAAELHVTRPPRPGALTGRPANAITRSTIRAAASGRASVCIARPIRASRSPSPSRSPMTDASEGRPHHVPRR